MNSRTALEQWLGRLPDQQLVTLLEERDLPLSAGHTRITTFRQLAEHLLTDESTAHALAAGTAGEMQLLASVAAQALERHGPVADEAAHHPTYAWRPAPPPTAPVEPSERLVAEKDVLAWFLPGDARDRAAAVLGRLRERALLLPAPRGQLALPPLMHVRAAGFAGYGRPAEGLLTAAYNAPEVKRIAATLLGDDSVRTRPEAQERITALLADPGRVQAVVAEAPPRARELLDRLVDGPPLLRTRCFVSRYGGYAGPDAKYMFREGGSGDEGTDWLAARALLLPTGPDLVELPYEVARALRDRRSAPRPRLDPEPMTQTVRLPSGWDGQGSAAAGAAAWRAEVVLRALAARPVAVRKAGGIAVRDTRRLAKEAGASEEDTRLWLDLAANAGLAAPQDEEPEPAPRGRRRPRSAPNPSARLLPSDRFDRWASAPPAGKLLPLLAAWAVLPTVLTHWPDADETPVALVIPEDDYAVPLRRGVLRALAGLPQDHGLTGTAEAHAELLERTAWYQPVLRALLASDGIGQLLGDDDLMGRLRATMSEAELLGLVTHGALTSAGRAVNDLLEAGAAHHYPAVPGASVDPTALGADGLGEDLTVRPVLAQAVAGLRTVLYRMLPAPSTTARFQADLTATVTGAPAPDLAELLSAVGDIESEGHAVVWRITAPSLRRALDAGWSADEILDRLTAVSERSDPLPQPLAYTIKDTARTHGQLRVVRSACCVRSDDTALIAEVAQARGLAKLRLRRIAPTVLISTAPPEETLAALRAAGYAPTQEAETGTTVLERAPAERAPSLLPTLDQAHAAFGEPVRGMPACARALASRLREGS
ncbi:helicase-associated domain-containing protein [Streptomyces sp. ISL-86]|uniref:helicase-associated domain-containing protein n=1 Tax=Streptomyces sp. ISL-86 TaxID=2819187 RepID=UPI001BEBABF9|nr:helicase-associated domain-containing protein [Streptomyces sp. ISL-86]MBT2456921.1 helicase-associated domain-containing protein [Streptomyces sp. ISL-86]